MSVFLIAVLIFVHVQYINSCLHFFLFKAHQCYYSYYLIPVVCECLQFVLRIVILHCVCVCVHFVLNQLLLPRSHEHMHACMHIVIGTIIIRVCVCVCVHNA